MENITLRVAEAPQNVAGRGIAVIDPELISRLSWRAGEVIEITGKKKAYALIWPGQIGDYGKNIIRIDGNIRNDAGVGLDDRVTIRRVEAKATSPSFSRDALSRRAASSHST
jgi:transitional endoplasmic reticulum ATPase